MSVEEDLKFLKEHRDKLVRLNQWLEKQSESDRANFAALVKMPHARKVLEKCPSEEFKEMGLLALELQEVMKLVAKAAQDIYKKRG